ncbi:helix-turn-helix transcriptional regulator [Staphylococcus felis]|uniref:helix-turn-helix transcriptional regulator n=2 Tax=Staphylococcus felis TaxID=46127 RepID=UPI000E23E3D0|nr:HTH domain-containing protein [Staphylococcus felis]REH85592.1 DNA-binding transcriptional regulator [Staphylococcus felis]
MKKETRQCKLIEMLQAHHYLTAHELSDELNVSKRTILRDIQELENKGVRILAHTGKNGGYELQPNNQRIHLDLSEHEAQALYLILKERQSLSALPYQEELKAIQLKLSRQPSSTLKRRLKQQNDYIKIHPNTTPTLPKFFEDIFIYCQERKVMGIDYQLNNGQTTFANIVFIGIICENNHWQAVVFHIGGGFTSYIDIVSIEDISYSFHKSINTTDITLDNFTHYLKK